LSLRVGVVSEHGVHHAINEVGVQDGTLDDIEEYPFDLRHRHDDLSGAHVGAFATARGAYVGIDASPVLEGQVRERRSTGIIETPFEFGLQLKDAARDLGPGLLPNVSKRVAQRGDSIGVRGRPRELGLGLSRQRAAPCLHLIIRVAAAHGGSRLW
jgi:hypothetical protein